MTAENLKNLLKNASIEISKFGLSIQPTKTWIYKDLCAVADFSHNEIKFAVEFFDLNENLRITFTPRTPDIFAEKINKKLSKKYVVCESAPTQEAYEKCSVFLRDLIALIEISERRTENTKKVGILTLPLHSNVGGNLQAFAMMDVLKRLNHDPILIDRTHPSASYAFNAEEFNSRPLISDDFGLGKNNPHNKFIESNITPFTSKFYNSKELSSRIDNYNLDAIIFGSDQVWRPKYARDMLADLFGKFLENDHKNIKKIAYAASFGADTWEYTPQQEARVKPLIQAFDAVSVRELDAVEMCQNHFDRSAEHVLDPTLLLPGEAYAQLFSGIETNSSNKIITYILDGNDDKSSLIQNIAKQLNTDAHTTRGVKLTEIQPDDISQNDGRVERWLHSIYHAKLVITDSFHGVAFSILFNKPFIAYGNKNRGLSRFNSILEITGLKNRLITSAETAKIEDILKPIDWYYVNAQLEKLRKKSYKFIHDALSGNVENWENPLKTLCTGCGSCAALPNSGLEMSITSDGFWLPKQTAESIHPNAIKLCPFNTSPAQEVRDEDALAKIFLESATNYHPTAGKFEKCYVGYSTLHRPNSSSGGLGTYLLETALEYGVIDGVFTVKGNGANGYEYQYIDKSEDISSISKTPYYPVTMADIFKKIENLDGKFAISGVGCFIKAIRIRQNQDDKFRKKISLTTGLICGGLKSTQFTDYLAQKSGIEGHYKNPQYRVKNPSSTSNDYSFSAEDSQNKEHIIRMRAVGDMWGTGFFKNKACDFCTDSTTELADISLGDAWLPEYRNDGMGNNVIVTRSKVADLLVSIGIKNGTLVLDEVPITTILGSQTGGISHKTRGLGIRIHQTAKYSDLPIPAVRERFIKKIPAIEAVIHVLRERVRARSISAWRETKNSSAFDKRMKNAKNILLTITAYRNKDSAFVSGLIKQSAENYIPIKNIPSEFNGIKIIARWINKNIKNGSITLSELTPLIE